MNEQREKFERGLNECVEYGIPDDLDLWENIEAMVVEGAVPGCEKKRYFGKKKLVFLVVGAVVFGMGAYGASRYAYDLFQSELPGIDAKVEGVEISQSKTIDGATVNVEWAYADTEFVVIGYTVEDHLSNRTYGQKDAELWPVLFDEQIGSPPMDEPHADITDGSGEEFDVVGGTTSIHEGLWPWPMPNTIVLEAPDGLREGKSHDFRFGIPLIEEPVFEPGQEEVPLSEEPIIGPYAFDFTIPVKSASTIPVNQTVESNGLEMTLKSFVDSPARPEATVCMEGSPDRNYSWWPMSDGKTDPRELGGGCWILGADISPGSETASVTITSLDGVSKDIGANTNPGLHRVEQRVVEGPWKFEVELPQD